MPLSVTWERPSLFGVQKKYQELLDQRRVGDFRVSKGQGFEIEILAFRGCFTAAMGVVNCWSECLSGSPIFFGC